MYPSINQDATLILVYVRKKSKSMTMVLPPLIVFDNENITKKLEAIYKKTSTHSIKVEI